jgi:hypothetical protein
LLILVSELTRILHWNSHVVHDFIKNCMHCSTGEEMELLDWP